MTEIIKEKIGLLEDFCIISKYHDPRKKLVRKALKECGTEIKMEQMLHDVLMGNTTIDTVLKKRGLM